MLPSQVVQPDEGWNKRAGSVDSVVVDEGVTS